jgi:hypothetical protein
MLRIVVISLVLANLLLLAFQSTKPAAQSEVPAAQAVVEDPDIPTIHLFEELLQDQQLLAGSSQCFSLGPFHTVEQRDELRARLRGLVTGYSERQTVATVEKGYWVFLPPFDSLLEANQVLLSLRALGLKDVAVILDGEWKHAISLGYFLRQGNANRHRQQLKERGVAAQVRVRRDTEPRYWLDYEQGPGASLLEVDVRDFPNDFRQRVLPCPEIGFFGVAEKDPANATAVGGNSPVTNIIETGSG